MPVPPATVARRFALWLFVCSASAAPSFVWAQGAQADPAGMVTAVALFVVLYTAATCTAWFERFRRRPFVRETLYVGYGLRLFASLCMLLAVAAPDGRGMVLGFLLWPDLFGGTLSLRIVGLVLGNTNGFDDAARTFHGAFLTTCVQGTLLNVVIFLVMLVAYGLQRAVRKPPPDQAPRGFDVVVDR